MDNRTGHIGLRSISIFSKIGYGAGNYAYGLVSQVVSSYLVFYATAVLGLPGSYIGIAVSISVIWDAITDPIMGYISDNTRLRKFGRRHFYILIGSFTLGISNYLLWVVPNGLTNQMKLVWILVFLMMLKTAQTVYTTPYTALGAELSTDYNERTSIQGIRTIFFLIGLLFASVMGMAIFFKPTPQFPQGQLNPIAYRNIGLTSSIMAVVFGLICYFSTKRYIPFLPKAGDTRDDYKKGGLIGLYKAFKSALGNRQFKYVMLAYLFTNISSAIVTTLGLHIFTYTFNMKSQHVALVVGALFVMSIVSQPVWVAISKRFDKKPSVILGLVFCVVGCILFLIMVLMRDAINGNFVYILPAALLIGFGTGGLFSLPLSMVADTIDVEEFNTGLRREGIYYGCMTLGYKLSQSAAIFIMGLLLDIIKFDASLPVQSETTALSLGLILPIGSIISFALALFSYLKYDLDKEKIRDIQHGIISRNNKTGM